MCCLLEELSKYKQIRKCNVASFEKEKNQLRKCDVASCKKNATQKMQLWKLHFFAFSVAFVLVPLHFCLHFFRFFSRKKNTKVDQSCKKNATEKMQRRKLQKKCNGENASLEVAFFLHFPFRMNCLCMYRIFVSLHPFAFHYTPPPNPSSRPCPSPQLHLTLSAFHACSLLFTPLSPSTLSSEQEWRCWVEAEMNM